jgi:hypothetical protein
LNEKSILGIHVHHPLGDIMRKATFALAVSTAVLLSRAGIAADYPAAKEGDWVARDFKFHTGELMAEVRAPEVGASTQRRFFQRPCARFSAPA